LTVPAVLDDAQVQQFEREGWLSVSALVSNEWLDRLRIVTDEFIDASRALTESTPLFDLEHDHTAEDPRLRRLSAPTDLHATYWEFASQSVVTDVVCDLLGPNVKFHHSKLNFKAPRGGEEVKWHQDIQFWPHTNYDLCTVGVFLEAVVPGMGEVGFVPGSHAGELYDLYGDDGVWVGALSDADVARARVERAEFPTGPAGSITVHHCRTVHGSTTNTSDRPRPLLLMTFAACDAYSLTDLVKPSPHGEEVIRGEPARWSRHDPRPCLMPPGGPYRPIFAYQQREG
jgi:ectoine hydroxylase